MAVGTAGGCDGRETAVHEEGLGCGSCRKGNNREDGSSFTSSFTSVFWWSWSRGLDLSRSACGITASGGCIGRDSIGSCFPVAGKGVEALATGIGGNGATGE